MKESFKDILSEKQYQDEYYRQVYNENIKVFFSKMDNLNAFVTL
jgi:hypothetical protein